MKLTSFPIDYGDAKVVVTRLCCPRVESPTIWQGFSDVTSGIVSKRGLRLGQDGIGKNDFCINSGDYVVNAGNLQTRRAFAFFLLCHSVSARDQRQAQAIHGFDGKPQ